MDANGIYEKLAQRTGGALLFGVTGPTRTGKSTFVKRFMETLVLPEIDDPFLAERAKDELPQSGSGRTIMTSEPKFVPEEAIEISPDGVTHLSVRLIDSVGYVIPGAIGAEEDGKPRMVTTPWFDYEIPLTDAAEIGTKKVMEEHCTVGVVVTTDGSITDIPRADYADAEQRAVRDMQASGKPFVVLLNSTDPYSEQTEAMRQSLENAYGARVIAADCQTMDAAEMSALLSAILAEFPVSELRFFLPDWVGALDAAHPMKAALLEAMRRSAAEIGKLSETASLRALMRTDALEDCTVDDVDYGSGVVSCTLKFPEALFYQVLSEQSGFPIETDGDLMTLLASLSEAKQAYDKVAGAMEQVRATGYGIVSPAADEVQLETPQIIRKNGNYAIKLRASAPTIHMIRADIQTEVSPIVGDEKQSRELADYLISEYEDDTEKLWSSNIFGKSLYDLVSEGLSGKIGGLPDASRMKLRDCLTKIVNEGASRMICILI